MTVLNRIISGTIASWSIIGIGIIAQLVTVPIFLSNWSIEEYGAWITVQTIAAFIFTFDKSHQQYVGYEFIKLYNTAKDTLSTCILSAIVVSVTISSTEFFVIWGLTETKMIHDLLSESIGHNSRLLTESIKTLLIIQFSTLITNSVGGVLIRATYALGYYPRMTWWTALLSIVSAVTPAILVSLQYGLFNTVLYSTIAYFIVNLFMHADMIHILSRNNIKLNQFSWQLGWKNFLLSMPLFGKELLENLRQSGVRLILPSLTGPLPLVAFTTLRTGANVAFQGLNTITNPIMPELIRFVHQRKQANMEALFTTIWLIVIAVMVPGVVMLQFFVEPFFLVWTKGRVQYDGWVFGILSLSVLVYAIGQPAISIIVGNNLLKYQLRLSMLTTIIVVSTLFLFVPKLSIKGAALSLLIAEIIACCLNVYRAKKWLAQNNLVWPHKTFRPITFSVYLAAITICVYNINAEMLWVNLVFFVCLMSLLIVRYWQSLPLVTVARIKTIATSFQNRLTFLLQ